MGEVVNLSERRKRPEPVPTFDRVMERLFEALDLMEPVRGTGAAHKAVCDGIEMLLTREERLLAWPRK
ncbi:hypothetical protein GYN07_10500 [Rhizobium leguminosarum bv. viciae 248]|uniref:hypothetical protein n=1 Tax=Rhizobium TaxID=379 RepID=UPI000362D746|nr:MULTISPECIES: hypothetical protein [Rhizobium]MBY3233787.1 hypothetical protein [Rhizobium laguerreae]QHW24729.1 hypothetical protein GYN07_10500 [Rhizobium leguminosarum bv. viciae 248]